MNQHHNASQLEKELFQLIATHTCNATESMQNRFKQTFEDYLRTPKGMQHHSTTVSDLMEKRIEFSDSLYNDRLMSQTLYMDLEDRMKFVKEITEPDNLVFCLDTLIKSFKVLFSLNYEESKNFG
jgi:hypothetical protein